MIKKLSLYFHTLKFLKWVQIKYRFYYLIRNKLLGSKISLTSNPPKSSIPKLSSSIPSYTTWSNGDQFTFLNLSHKFDGEIDWNFSKYGKLWVYNLNYFEYLNQSNFPSSEGLRLIKNYIANFDSLKDGLEPFPISLRIVNWVKFLTHQNITDEDINQFLFVQTKQLIKNLEYHILGNHLLENGVALLFSGIYFNSQSFIQSAEKILISQLEEQILEDGGHFERSPMYHQIMLFRVLDCINLVTSNKGKCISSKTLLSTLLNTGSKMVSWLSNMTYSNGGIPLLNDSANGIAPTSEQLMEYSRQLNLKTETTNLRDSGYRKIEKGKIELVIDIGEIGPSYQPGHAHSDTLSFELRLNKQPFVVDTGTSTYEKSPKRQVERSTSSHNTVQVGDYEQSEVWGGFRVARRVVPQVTLETQNQLSAEYAGFRNNDYKHQRTFSLTNNQLDITDVITNSNKICKAYIHFHPSIKVNLNRKTIETNMGDIKTHGAESINLHDYQYADQFNRTTESKKVEIVFNGELKTSISW